MSNLEITNREVFGRIDMSDRSQIRHGFGGAATAYALLALVAGVALFFVAVNAIS